MSNAEDDIAQKNKLSRRNFLKGAAAGGAIGAIVVAGAAEVLVMNNPGGSTTTVTTTKTVTSSAPGTTTSTTVTPQPSTVVTLNVNGNNYATLVDNRFTLAFTLRHKLNLIGTKVGCDRGECGACSVLVDGVPMLSCMMLAVESVGHAITTVEGIGTPEKLSKIQAALCDADGIQCGACVPGVVVVSTAFLKANPNPALTDLKEALAGNLCKCGNWPHMFAGILAAK